MRLEFICLLCLVVGVLIGAVITHFKHKSQNKDDLQDYIIKMYSSNGKNLKKQLKQQQKQLKKTSKDFKIK